MKTLLNAIGALLLAAPTLLAQGSLTPPGAPPPTMKTLDQIEPRIDVATLAGDARYHHIIVAPGSYYLTGNIDVTRVDRGREAGNHVTSVSVAGGGGTAEGVSTVSNSPLNLVIHNTAADMLLANCR